MVVIAGLILVEVSHPACLFMAASYSIIDVHLLLPKRFEIPKLLALS